MTFKLLFNPKLRVLVTPGSGDLRPVSVLIFLSTTTSLGGYTGGLLSLTDPFVGGSAEFMM